jgi:trehalose 6-phosphate phosphatase
VKNILTDEEDETLRRYARGRVLLAFDFDGTLAPIVREPAAAAMRGRTEKLMTELAQLYPCVVISGRARADVMKKVDEVPLRAVIGNHGMEPSPQLRRATWLVASGGRNWHPALPSIAGITIEDKGVSARHPLPQGALARPSAARCSRWRPICVARRIVEGKMVVNVIPAGAPDKGSALITLRKRMRCQAAIYVGDDDNDEDVFALAKTERLLGIRIGRSRRSHAAYFVQNQAAIDQLLVKLAKARQPSKATAPVGPSTGSRPPARFRRAA